MDTFWLLLIIPVFFLVFGLMWAATAYLTATIAGMQRNMDDIRTGDLLRTSRYGSARIGWLNFNSTLKVMEYEDGYMLQTMPVLGSFKRWLPKQDLDIGPIKPAFIGSKRTVVSVGERLVFYSALARFFE